MKRLFNLASIIVLLAIFATSSFAQDGTETKVQNKRMVKAQTFQSMTTQGPNWVDTDGDGICDNFGTENQGEGNGKGYGLKDGTGSKVRSQDGTGFGKTNGSSRGFGTGIEDCDNDGSGTKGSNRRKGRK